jgi:phage terminase large subunit
VILDIPTAQVFEPLLQPSRYKGAHGGRGSGKSHFFAGLGVESCILQPGTRGLCVREIQKSLKESAKRLIEDKIETLGLQSQFDVLNAEIKTPGGGLISFVGMQDHTAEQIMSYEGLDWVWVEQGETLSARSIELLRPTIRKPNSELWFSWNPRRKTDPVDMLLRGPTPPPRAIVVQANWSDNPWLPQTLNDERTYDEANSPDTYQHVWEGDYVGVAKGAYYAMQLAQAKREGRITFVARDPLMTIRAVFDIGGTGAKADAVTIWVVQFVGKSINYLNYYEAVGQPLSAHVAWLRENDYDHCLCILPHDGASHDRVFDVTYESALKGAGFSVLVVPNQGAGAAMLRVDTARRLFPSMWFNEKTTEAGRAALGWYHEKRDDARGIGLGPEHDWASNGADSFGLSAIAYDEPRIKREEERELRTIAPEDANTAWLGN